MHSEGGRCDIGVGAGDYITHFVGVSRAAFATNIVIVVATVNRGNQRVIKINIDAFRTSPAKMNMMPALDLEATGVQADRRWWKICEAVAKFTG